MEAVVYICNGDVFTPLMKEFSDFCDEVDLRSIKNLERS